MLAPRETATNFDFVFRPEQESGQQSPNAREAEAIFRTAPRALARHAKLLRPWLSLFLVLLALVALPEGAFGQAAAFQTQPPAGPLLHDVFGWNQPKYYSTIQTADVDGDGQKEIIGRWKDGLHVWQLTNGAWIQTSMAPALSDALGWDQPSRYSTIRFAVLKPHSHQADLIARSSDGIHVWRYNGKTKQWFELGANASSRPFADKDETGTDWTNPSHYTTIQVGDLDGDGQDELIGRGKNGLEVFHWNENLQTWQALAQSGPYADSAGFGQEPYYYSFHVIELDEDRQGLVARAPSGIQVLRWHASGWQIVSSGGPFSDGAGYKGSRVL